MIRKLTALVAGASFVAAMAMSARALAAVDPQASAAAPAAPTANLASQYAGWAGGKSNFDSLLAGLRTGSSVTLVTRRDNVRSIAGFTPQARMSDAEIAAALASARGTLASFGIRQPTADQIQAALIGGEVVLANGDTRLVQGPVPLLQQPVVSPVAAR